ncbi:MAG: hypothetical protein LDLANPLL_02114 [Turneriella sp.]|nr:hypothetical protein [Turneriella sp.]
MVLKYKLVHFLWIFSVVFFPLAADFDTASLPESLETKLETYFKMDASKARANMANFTSDEIQKIANAFKKTHSRSDQRLFWLIEEGFRRNAEINSAQRILYLYLAVLAALAIIGAFTLFTYMHTRRLTTKEVVDSIPETPEVVSKNTTSAPHKTSTKKKK